MRKLKWLVLLLGIGALVGTIAYWVAEAYLLRHAERDVQDLLLAHRGLHHYIQRTMHPEFYRARDAGYVDQSYYAPEIFSSSFMVRTLHGFYNEERARHGLPPVYYKLAADNPRNPVNAADADERRILDYFRSHPRELEYREIITDESGTQQLVFAMPFLRTEARCLKCHGRREDSPPGLQARYPGEGGFGEAVGQLRAVESLRVSVGGENRAAFLLSAAVLAALSVLGGLVFFNRSLARAVKERTAALVVSEEQLRQAQKLESIGRLAGGVAHDFNNMLTIITSHAELARDDLSPEEPVREDLDQILGAADRSAKLTRQLLAFARKQTVQPRSLDLCAEVEGMTSMLQRLIGEEIQLQWTPSPEPCVVHIDPSQLDQILANLAVNARDAIGGPGQLRIAAQAVVVEEGGEADLEPGEYVLLEVADTGRGMDEETLAHAFEPFFTTKGVGRGTGLGLATVWGIVKQNRGQITVESEPGRGTTFRIHLPRVLEAPAQQSGPNEARPRTGSEHLLLVEDDDGVRRGLSRILEQTGYRVTQANGPSAALALFAEHGAALQLILTDVIMPEMSGPELVEQLQAQRPDLPVVFMSGYPAEQLATRGVLEREVHFLPKPVTAETLLRRVRRALDGPAPQEASRS